METAVFKWRFNDMDKEWKEVVEVQVIEEVWMTCYIGGAEPEVGEAGGGAEVGGGDEGGELGDEEEGAK